MKKSLPKLTLKKETLRELKSTESSLVLGGDQVEPIDTTWPSCPSVKASC
jgi:hypothetical protein